VVADTVALTCVALFQVEPHARLWASGRKVDASMLKKVLGCAELALIRMYRMARVLLSIGPITFAG
jgi:hypothetical protein